MNFCMLSAKYLTITYNYSINCQFDNKSPLTVGVLITDEDCLELISFNVPTGLLKSRKPSKCGVNRSFTQNITEKLLRSLTSISVITEIDLNYPFGSLKSDKL